MEITEAIRNELEAEAELLDHFRGIIESSDSGTLYCRNPKGRPRQFFVKKPGMKKVRYIRKSEADFVAELVKAAIAKESVRILEKNTEILNKACESYVLWSSELVSSGLSRAYQYAMKDFGIGGPDEEKPKNGMDTIDTSIPSENPYKREQLQYKVSNGLLVRTKSEALIAEFLLAAGIPFRYEKRLELASVYKNEAGFEESVIEVVYPDFTIYLPDGSITIWEHEGLMEQEKYRKRNVNKL